MRVRLPPLAPPGAQQVHGTASWVARMNKEIGKRLGDVGRQAVERLREIVASGRFESVAAVDPQSGEIVDADARVFFAALPAISPATAPEELVEHGLLTHLPSRLNAVYAQPKYRAGRELFVRASISHVVKDRHRPVGVFDVASPIAMTHRAVLRGQRGGAFMVEVDGADVYSEFGREQVLAWNEPYGVSSSGGSLSGVRVDFNDPLWKAHVCAGYLEHAQAISALDFGAPVDEVEVAQARLVQRIASRVRMRYSGRGEGYAGPRAASLMSRGLGVCFVQRAVATAYLQSFARVLALEVQAAIGRTLRLDVPHGFAVVLLRPSLRRYVCDPAWSEPLTDLQVAFFGPGWGHDRRLVGFEGTSEGGVRPDDVDVPEVSAT